MAAEAEMTFPAAVAGERGTLSMEQLERLEYSQLWHLSGTAKSQRRQRGAEMRGC